MAARKWLIFLTLTLGQAFTPAAAQPDRIFLNGAIYTQDSARPNIEALAISGGRITATGNNADIRALAGPSTQVIDLGGRRVIPGLIDSHIHAIRAGLTWSTEISWIGVPAIAEAIGRIRAAAAQSGDWIVVAGGWNSQQFRDYRRPSLAEIEDAAPGRAVYIQHAYNSVLMTSAALRRLGIEGDKNLPAGAHFESGKDDVRTGWINGTGPAIIALFDRLPKNGIEENVQGTRHFFRRLNALGITGVIDPGGHNIKPPDYAALFEIASRGELTLRVAFSAFAPRAGQERDDLEKLVRDFSAQARHPLLTFNGLGENIAWSFYNNNVPSPEDARHFEDVALWAAQNGHRVTIHWNNGSSAHHLLDALERINAKRPLRDLRWSIAHLHDGSRETLQRMHAMGLGWLAQNAVYFSVPSWLRARGEALRETPPLGSALRMGIPVGGGTDAHRVMSYNPFLSLRWMIDGVTLGGLSTREGSELLTREQALRVYTLGSAWFTGDEARRGTLAPGRDADLAVLDRDYFSVPLAEFGSMKSQLTLVAGRIVYADGPFTGLEESTQSGSTAPARPP